MFKFVSGLFASLSYIHYVLADLYHVTFDRDPRLIQCLGLCP